MICAECRGVGGRPLEDGRGWRQCPECRGYGDDDDHTADEREADGDARYDAEREDRDGG